MTNQTTPPVRPAAALLVLAIAGCSGGGGEPARIDPRSMPLHAAGTGAQDGDAAAAAFLEVADTIPTWAGRPALRTALAETERLAFHALAQIETAGLAAGAGTGAHLAGSQRIRRLAGDPTAPADANGNGTNLDETIAAEHAVFAELTGGAVPAGAAPAFLPWRESHADLAGDANGAARGDHAAWRTVAAPTAVVRTEQLGRTLLARALAAAELLEPRRGALIGRTPAEGMLGLVAVQQALAIEETLAARLFHDGAALGSIGDAKAYDPRAEPRWVPAEFAVVEDLTLRAASPALPAVPESFVADDPASDLAATASLLRGLAELAFVASPNNQYSNLNSLFSGAPFGSSAGGGPQPGGGVDDDPTFLQDILPITQTHCASCHGLQFPNSGFVSVRYEDVISYVNQGRRAVVPGDHTQSSMWILVDGIWQNPPGRPFPIQRMPVGGGRLPQADIDLIARWIDTGAKKDRPIVQPPPAPGIELARVLYRNLAVLHAGDPGGSGPVALHHRYHRHPELGGAERDERSRFVDARAAGMALSALAAYAWIDVDPPTNVAVPAPRELTERVGRFVAERLVLADGRVAAGFDLIDDVPVAGADVAAQAAVAAGLFAAARLTFAADLADAARRAARVLVDEHFGLGGGLFAVQLGDSGHRYDAATIAAVLGALVETVRDGEVPGARDAFDDFVRVALPHLVHAEFDGLGETMGDGVADTDRNGIPEPALAGGAHGLAPLFAAEIAVGTEPKPRGVITWTEHVRPLFRAKCVGCHVDGARLGEYRVDTPALAAMHGESGRDDLVVPGDPDASFLYRKLADRDPGTGVQMPERRPPLDARGLRIVWQWIADGARYR